MMSPQTLARRERRKAAQEENQLSEGESDTVAKLMEEIKEIRAEKVETEKKLDAVLSIAQNLVSEVAEIKQELRILKEKKSEVVTSREDASTPRSISQPEVEASPARTIPRGNTNEGEQKEPACRRSQPGKEVAEEKAEKNEQGEQRGSRTEERDERDPETEEKRQKKKKKHKKKKDHQENDEEKMRSRREDVEEDAEEEAAEDPANRWQERDEEDRRPEVMNKRIDICPEWTRNFVAQLKEEMRKPLEEERREVHGLRERVEQFEDGLKARAAREAGAV
jgi:hypothetical protein